MRQLLANASPATRDCLERQIGTIATRNSCRAPWSSNASIGISLDRAKFRMPQRANVSFSLTNPLGAADLAVNGSGHLKGWGQSPFPDQSLLYVRGFDPGDEALHLQVNQRFGATRPELVTIRQPVVLTTSVRFDLGAMRERQTLGQQLGSRTHAAGHPLSRGALPIDRREQHHEPDGDHSPPTGFAAPDIAAGRQHRVDEPSLHVSLRLPLGAGRALPRRAARRSTTKTRRPIASSRRDAHRSTC